ncbi:asparagine synthase-related protein [uncultured Thiodictyon sp.]|uniref:asparagine synthetase B family protein n=1 Tax=uncultured Thiodictyon sp. TaxID=1846217 RepID=UPI0025DB864D|nr:asparagine synthase-related protein [uncultured Thiodictyon sp.]
MSGLYGELSLTNAAPTREAMAAMDRAMADWGPDGAGQWQDGPLALGARLLRVTLEDAHDQQPLIEPDLVLAGHIRLDAREALARELGLECADCRVLPDSRLVALAWRRWGEGCAEHLLGDWVCAIWDRRRRCLWIGRDAAGNTCVYFWRDPRRLVFSTSLKAVLAHPGVPRQPDAYHIARLLTSFVDPGEADSTAYVGIRRLAGGHALRAGAAGSGAYRWWHPHALSQFESAPAEEYLGAFRDLYRRVVNDRLRKDHRPVAVMLSSGLDSSSVAAFAAPALAAGGERLLAYTSVPCFAPDGAKATRLGDEGPLARAVAEHIGNIDFIPVSAARVSLMASLERLLEIHDQPQNTAANYYWMLEILRQAQQRGARVLLTGQGGNATVSWTGTGDLLPDLLVGRWGVLVAAFRHTPVGPARLIKRQLLQPILDSARRTLLVLRGLGPDAWGGYSAIHPALAQRVQLSRRMRAVGHSPDFSVGAQDRMRFRLGIANSAALGATWMNNGAAHQLDVRDPTRDRRLIEFCWRIPDWVFWSHGRQRALISRGLAGDLPEPVLQGVRRGLQAADIGHRAKQDGALIKDALTRLERHPLAGEWLDIPKMRDIYHRLERDVSPETTGAVTSILLRGLGVGLFLERF